MRWFWPCRSVNIKMALVQKSNWIFHLWKKIIMILNNYLKWIPSYHIFNNIIQVLYILQIHCVLNYYNIKQKQDLCKMFQWNWQSWNLSRDFQIHRSLCYIYYKYASVVGMRKIVVISRSLVTNLVIRSVMFFHLPSSNTCHTTRLKNHIGEHGISRTN